MATQQIDLGRQAKAGTLTNTQVAAGAGIASTKLANWSADRNAGGFKLTNLATPSADTDAATKGYVDGAIQSSAAGLDVKASARVASTANVSGTYNATGGASGRGQFTGMPNSLDGVTLAAGNRVLLKDQSTGAQNGIWVVTTLGTGSNGVWDRASDFDADSEVTANVFIFVEEGTTNADSGWVLTTNDPITIGGSSGTALAWTQFSGAGTIVAGNGLTKTGNTLDVQVDGVGIEINADTLRLKDLGVVTAKIADGAVTADKIAAAVAGNGLAGGAGAALSVNVDGTGIEINADTLRLKDLGVVTAKINDLAVTTGKIADAAVTAAKLAAAVAGDGLAGGAGSALSVNVDSVGIEINADTLRLKDLGVTTAKLADAAVTAAKLAAAVAGGGLDGGAGSALSISFLWEAPTGTKNGVNTAFTLSSSLVSNAGIVFLNGVQLTPTTHYSISGTTLTMGDAPSSGDELWVFGFKV